MQFLTQYDIFLIILVENQIINKYPIQPNFIRDNKIPMDKETTFGWWYKQEKYFTEQAVSVINHNLQMDLSGVRVIQD